MTSGESLHLCGPVSPSVKWSGRVVVRVHLVVEEGRRIFFARSHACLLPPWGALFFLCRKFTQGSKLDLSTMSSLPNQLTDHWSQDHCGGLGLRLIPSLQKVHLCDLVPSVLPPTPRLKAKAPLHVGLHH